MATQASPARPSRPAAPKPFATIEVNTRHYLAVVTPERVKARLAIGLSSHSYLPRIDDLQSDWVAHVAAPAFKLFRRQQGGEPVNSFCTIGTGSGLDALAAVELLGARRIGLTDVHEDVVAIAANNVAANHLPAHPIVIESGYGDLLEPLRPFGARYHLIYENLPNVPLSDAAEIARDRKSSTHVAPRREPVPERIKRQMLDLHYLALLQAKEFLLPGGAVLSTLGGRVPLQVLLSLGSLAGYSPSLLTYTWKVQADPKEVIGDHARKQREGFGPFYFYRAATLQEIFASVDLEASGQEALRIEQSLLPERLDALQAFEALEKGERIGHTVAVLKSRRQ